MRLSRRRFLAGLACVSAWPGLAAAAPNVAPNAGARHMGVIPSSGESVPVIGMGSYITFDVGDDAGLRAARTEVLRAFFEAGGGMIDSSPMYGTSEEVIGHCLAQLGHPPGLFSATKVWTWLEHGGEQQMRRSRSLWGLPRFDLIQVHNLLGWEKHLPNIRRDRDAGLVRYVGVTTSHGRRHAELERLMRTEPLDFVQLTYNILDREVERGLLPLAVDQGIAVIVNRPFRRGELIRRLSRHPLPPWAGELGCTSWAQFLLRFVSSHPAVTCVIPATSRVDHMRENMAMLHGPRPDQAMRQEMIDYVSGL